MSTFGQARVSDHDEHVKPRSDRAAQSGKASGVRYLQQVVGNAAVARMIADPTSLLATRNSSQISRLFVLTDKKSYDTAEKGAALGVRLYEKFEIADKYPKIKEAEFAQAVGVLAAEKERFGGKGMVSEAQVRDEVLKRLTQTVEETGRAVTWAVETDRARLSQAAYNRLLEVGCTDDNINAAMNGEASGQWNVIKKLKGQGDLWELKVNGAGAIRCNGKAGTGGKIEFLVAGKGIGK